MTTSKTAFPAGVIYARYSSHAQRDVSIDQQLRACRLFAEREGIEIVGTYEDRALSGTTDRRPCFQQMIKDAEKHRWNYIIVYALDRFARNRYDSAVYKQQLRGHGVKVLSSTECISDDPSGVLMESVLEGFAEYYSKELARKVVRGMEDNARQCMVNGPLPLGFVRGSDGRYAVDEVEAAVVRESFERIAAGDQIVDLINDFNRRGILTKRGQKWNKSSFGRLFSNERYIGVYIYGDTRIPGGIPAIIDKELFDTVQYVLHNKRNPRSGSGPQRRRRENSVYLLTGKLFCGHCKSPMIGVSGKSQAATPYYYYTCKGRREHNGCTKAPLRREYVERAVTAALKANMLNDAAINALADAAIEYRNNSEVGFEIEALNAHLIEIRKSIKNLISAIEAGVFSVSTQQRLLELEEEEKVVAGNLNAAREEIGKQLTKEEIIATLKLYQSGCVDDPAYQETLIDTFLVAAYVYDNDIKLIFNLGNGNRKEASIAFDIDDVLPDGDIDVRIDSCTGHQ